MKKIFAGLIVMAFLFSVSFVGAVTEDGVHETGDKQIADETVIWKNTEEMEAEYDIDFSKMVEDMVDMNDEERQEYVEKEAEKLPPGKELTINIGGDSYTSTDSITSDKDANGNVYKEGYTMQSGVVGADTKEVTGIQDVPEGVTIAHGAIHNVPKNNKEDKKDEDDEEDCEHDTKSHKCKSDSTTGTKATTETIPFLASIDPTSESTKTSPLQIGSSFKILGNKHIIREGDNPNFSTTSDTCGKKDTIICSTGEHTGDKTGSKCTKSITIKDYGTPVYQDHYKGVKVEFTGFKVRVGENDVTSDTISTSSSTESQESTRPELTNDKYSKGYIITKILKDKLVPDSTTGLLKGKIKVTCLCENAESETFDVYFNITDVIIDEDIFNLTVKVDGYGTATIGDKGETTASGPIDTPFNIKAKADEGYIFDAWYEPNDAYYRGEPNWYKTAKIYNDIADCIVDMPGYNYVLIARFIPKIPKTYKVEIYTDGNGTVNVDGLEGKRLCLEVPEGENLNIDAIPYKDSEHEYKFYRWTEIIDGEERIYSNNEPLVLSVNRDYILVARFKGIRGNFHTLTIDINSKNNGFVIPYGDIDAIAGRSYDIYAFPYDNFYFRYWKDNNGNKPRYGQFDTIIMPNKDYELIAYIFNVGNNQLRIESAGGGKVALDDEENFRLEDSRTVLPEDSDILIDIKAKPNRNFEFDYFEDEYGRRIYKEECEKENGVYKYPVKVEEDILYVAYFEYLGEGYKLTVDCTEGGSAFGNVNNAAPGEWYRVYAKAYAGYSFRTWRNDEGKQLGAYERIWIEMKNRDYTVTAYFKDRVPDKTYKLTIEKDGNGSVTGTGEYPRGKNVPITATPNTGYKFAGWYEDNALISKQQNDSIYMYRDRNLVAKFVKDDEDYNSSFKVISIRDLRWQDYFVSGGKQILNNYLTIPKNATKNTVLVNSASLVDPTNTQDRRVVYGYAVECELTTTDIECDVSNLIQASNPELLINAKVKGNRSGEIDIPTKYETVSSKTENNIDSFMISATKTYKEITVDGISITTPVITWRWVYYLPLDLEWLVDKQNSRNKEELVVEFEIKVKVNENTTYDYIKAIKTVDGNNWEGKVFTYRTDKTLLDDIYDNAQN